MFTKNFLHTVSLLCPLVIYDTCGGLSYYFFFSFNLWLRWELTLRSRCRALRWCTHFSLCCSVAPLSTVYLCKVLRSFHPAAVRGPHLDTLTFFTCMTHRAHWTLLIQLSQLLTATFWLLLQTVFLMFHLTYLSAILDMFLPALNCFTAKGISSSNMWITMADANLHHL